ncbi:MAG: hypothetical protein WDW36_008854 [Sanguina aurantia]
MACNLSETPYRQHPPGQAVAQVHSDAQTRRCYAMMHTIVQLAVAARVPSDTPSNFLLQADEDAVAPAFSGAGGAEAFGGSSGGGAHEDGGGPASNRESRAQGSEGTGASSSQRQPGPGQGAARSGGADSPPQGPPPGGRRTGFSAYQDSDAPAPGSDGAPSPAAGEGEPGHKFAGVSRRKQEQMQKGDEEKVKRNTRYDDLANGEGSILEIPELEEEGKEDLTRLVAEAPRVRLNKVQDIAELDEDVQFRLPTTEDKDIDLSLLTAVLCSSEQVHEDDEIWDPDMLLTQVASELNQELEKAEGVTESDKGDVVDPNSM